MITKDQIAKAISDADRKVELTSLPQWGVDEGVSPSGLQYVAEQRALRAAMVLEGKDPTNRTTQEVRLDPAIQALMPTLAGLWMDGFAGGLTAGRRHPKGGELSSTQPKGSAREGSPGSETAPSKYRHHRG